MLQDEANAASEVSPVKELTPLESTQAIVEEGVTAQSLQKLFREQQGYGSSPVAGGGVRGGLLSSGHDFWSQRMCVVQLCFQSPRLSNAT